MLSELEAARRFWLAQGHNPANSRIGVYERELRGLVAVGPDGRGNLPDEERGRAHLLLAEIGDFLFFSQAAISFPRLAASPRVRNIFSGPELAREEETATHANPRNTLLELTLAAAIERAGMLADLSGVTDIRATFNDTPLRLECKRPQNMNKAETAIRKAAQQLEVSHTPDSLGMIVICIGKLLTDGERMLVAKDRATMEGRIHLETDQFIQATARYWHNKPHVAGIMVRVMVPGVIEDEKRPYNATLFTGTNRPGLPQDQRRVLSGFLQKLQAGLGGA